MSNPLPKTATIEIHPTDGNARHIGFVDSFGIYPNGSFTELHFGFCGGARDPIDGVVVMIPAEVIASQKESLLAYLKQSGFPSGRQAPPIRIRQGSIFPADVIGLARQGSTAEIIFHAFSWKLAIESAKSETNKTVVSPLCVTLLRCDLDMQMRWILELYEPES